MVNDATTRVDGVNVRYLEAGSGPAIILLHGASLGSSAEVFEDFLQPLAEAGYRAVAYDQPGYGLTDNPTDYTNSYRARFIPKVMDALAIERAALVGHSQSGGFAVQIALLHPQRVTGVFIVSTGPLLPPMSDEAPARERPGMAEAARPPETDPTLEETRKLLESDVFQKPLITSEVVERRHRLSIGKNVAAAAGRAEAREPRQDGKPPWKQLTDLTQPLVMLYGDHDRAAAGKRAVLLKEQQPEIDVRVVSDAAHMLMWDRPDVFLRVLVQFLGRVNASTHQPAAI